MQCGDLDDLSEVLTHVVPHPDSVEIGIRLDDGVGRPLLLHRPDHAQVLQGIGLEHFLWPAEVGARAAAGSRVWGASACTTAAGSGAGRSVFRSTQTSTCHPDAPSRNGSPQATSKLIVMERAPTRPM